MKRKTIKTVLASTLASATLFCSAMAWSEVAVIVHPSNGNSLSSTDITRIFLGKKKSFPDGSDAIPVDQKDGSAIRSKFVSMQLKKNDQQLKAYWAQLLFTGKGTPPQAVGSSVDVRKLISENPALVGYIDSADVDDSVKVIHQF